MCCKTLFLLSKLNLKKHLILNKHVLLQFCGLCFLFGVTHEEGLELKIKHIYYLNVDIFQIDYCKAFDC